VSALSAATFVAWFVAKSENVPALLGVGVVGLVSLLLIGRFFGRLSTVSALVLLVAPLACWATEIPLLRTRKKWIVELVRLVLVAIPLIVVLILAKQEFDREMAPLLTSSQSSTFLAGRTNDTTQLKISRTTWPLTSVRRKSLPP
jgi:predicted MFS family arabinose efflux permease